MIKGVESASERFLVDLTRITDKQARIQEQISSGVRVNRASDAPDSVINILELRSDLERAKTVDANLNRITSEVDTAEAAVRVAVQLVERARVLAAEAATATATSRKASAIEARQIHDQLVSLTRTVSEGRHVFSGDLDTQGLYEVDDTQPGGVNRLAVASNTRKAEDINGSQFSFSRSAHEIFDVRDGADAPAENNVFAATHELYLALESDDLDGVSAAIPKVAASLDHLNRQITFYGRTQNRVATGIELTKESIVSRTKELGLVQDTDIAEALSQLTSNDVHFRAAIGAHAQMPRATLFDVLG